MRRTEMNRELLEQQFNEENILQRKGYFGQMLSYIPAHLIIQRLNDALDGQWSFEIVEYQQMGDEVVVLGRLTAGGVTKMQFGNSKVTKAKETDDIISIGDDIKAAASDCIKKAATLLGVGLHLYGDLAASSTADATTGDAATNMSDMSSNQGQNLITKAQLSTIKKLRTKLKWTPEDVQSKAQRLFSTTDIAALNTTMGTALIAYLRNQGNGKSVGK
jgi:Rad52/22 family double-strand break repair protein